MNPRRAALLATAGLLGALVSFPAPVSAALVYSEHGWVYAPTVTPIFPGDQAWACQGCTVWELDGNAISSYNGLAFTLTTIYILADFDVFFYASAGNRLAAFDNPGNEAGSIPLGAASGYVILFAYGYGEFDFKVYDGAPSPPPPPELHREHGVIAAATVTPIFPGDQAWLCQGCTAWELDAAAIANNNGQQFKLYATDVLLLFADFDVFFYSPSGSRVGAAANPGDEQGTVPPGAASGYVILFGASYGEFDFVIFGQAPPPPPQACADGLDNDGDGLVDYPADPGCTSADDNDESNPPPPKQCNDGLDNDGDGKVDYPQDPGCSDLDDNDETDTPPVECNDGLDNDDDTKVDYPADRGCTSATDTSEFNTPVQCEDGIDNDADGKTDYPADPGCQGFSDDDEANNPIPACSDSADNDADGMVDYPSDPGCTDPSDADENGPPTTPTAPSGPASGQPGQSLTYTTSSTDPDGNTIRYTFDWGDTTQTATDPMPSGVGVASSHSWSSPGSYCVKARAVDSRGAGSEWSGCTPVAISGANNPPFACWGHSRSGMRLFTDASCSSDPDGNTLTYSWSWGDGTTGAGVTASHTYRDRGNYRVELTVSDGSATDSSAQTVTMGPSDPELAQAWAPVFYHDTDSSDYPAEEFTRFDFDGVGQNWAGKDNWENEPGNPHPGWVYYYVLETPTNFHVGYMVFHPRDWDEGSFIGEHENDMEGALVLVQKDASSYGQFLAVHTQAHGHFWTYTDWDQTPSSGVTNDPQNPNTPVIDGDVNFWTGDGSKHVELGVEAKGHGMYRKTHSTVWNPVTDNFWGGDGNVHLPRGIAEQPGSGAGGPRGNDRDVSYALRPFNELWDRRTDYDGLCAFSDTCTFAVYGQFRGDNGAGENKANAPWIWDEPDNDGPTLAGDWFCHPARLSDVYLNGLGAYSWEYVYRDTGPCD